MTASETMKNRIRSALTHDWQTAYNIGWEAGYSGRRASHIIMAYFSDIVETREHPSNDINSLQYRLKENVEETIY